MSIFILKLCCLSKDHVVAHVTSAEVLWETTSGEGETSQGFPILNIVSIDETIVCFERPLGFTHMVAKTARVCAAEDHVRGGGESSRLSLWKVPLCSTLTLFLSQTLLPLQHFIFTYSNSPLTPLFPALICVLLEKERNRPRTIVDAFD